MFGVFRRPQAEPIMMLAGQNQSFHSRRGGCARNLIRIKINRIEDCRRLISVTPLFVGESVEAEMNEAVELHFMPAKLAARRYWTVGFRWFSLLANDARRRFFDLAWKRLRPHTKTRNRKKQPCGALEHFASGLFY